MGQTVNQHDFDYFARRAQEEQRAAELAEHSEARRAHQRLADQYCELAQMRGARFGPKLEA